MCSAYRDLFKINDSYIGRKIMQISEKIAEYVINVQYDQIPEDIVQYTKLAILDYFSSAIAGCQYEPIKMIEDLIKEMGGKEQATTISGHKNSVLNVALYNGATGHIVELDDIHK